jgi:outer membrane protein OmpA-like peptidoglycan-associated protein
MKLQIKLLLSFTAFCFLFPLQNLEGQTNKAKKLKRPTSRVGISSVDTFVRESFDLYDKVYMYDGYTKGGKPLTDDDYEILIDAVEDAERVTVSAPNAVADVGGANFLKQGKATLQLNRAKKALKYSLITGKKLLTTKGKDKDESQTDQTSSTSRDNANTSSDNSNNSNSSSTKLPEPKKDIKIYSKFDFVPGDKLIFFDDFSKDYIGDFPSKWNTNGSGEVVTINDSPEKWFGISPGFNTKYIPDVTLPEEYTIEFDVLVTGVDKKTSSTAVLTVILSDEKAFNHGDSYFHVSVPFCQYIAVGFRVRNYMRSGGGAEINNVVKADIRQVVLNQPHISIAVNKQRFRLWVNEKKYVDIPRGVPLNSIHTLKFELRQFKDGKERLFLRNLKVAEGGVDLRRQLIEEGSVSTNGILFDSGSANIQPQSYGIIRQISQVLQQESDMKLKIVGHTDADGADSANLALSKKRAASVKNALITIYNISGDRLQTDGKGESVPVGDNKTTDGKAQNRRVEFIKI